MRRLQGQQVRVMVKAMVTAMFMLLFAGNYIFPPGQDGNIFSYYYDNWLAPWSDGQYLPAFMSQWSTDSTLTVQPLL